MPDDRCPNCGNPVGSHSTRCSFCGSQLPPIQKRPLFSYVQHTISQVSIKNEEQEEEIEVKKEKFEIEVKLFTCPFCSNKSLFKAPHSEYYECLYLPCKAFGYSVESAKNIEIDGEEFYIFQLKRK